MNTWTNAVITNQGMALQAKLIEGTTLNITRAVTGSGYVNPTLLAQQTAVSNIQQTLTFRTISYPETGKVRVPAVLDNDGLTTGYTAMQVGFYAEDPDEGEILYFIAQADSGAGIPIPSESEMASFTAEWDFYFQYGQADSVSVTVDPAGAVSREEVLQMIDDDDALTYKGNCTYAQLLAITDAKVGDMWEVTDQNNAEYYCTTPSSEPAIFACDASGNETTNVRFDFTNYAGTIGDGIYELRTVNVNRILHTCKVALYKNGVVSTDPAIESVQSSNYHTATTTVDMGGELSGLKVNLYNTGDFTNGDSLGYFKVTGSAEWKRLVPEETSELTTEIGEWTAATLPASAAWYSVTYGAGKFVAVANGTAAAYSTDGINWTAATLPASGSWESVTYGNGKFVAVGYGSTAAAYSTDGINWTAATLPASGSWESVTYGNGKFVAVGYGSTAAAYSEDGINWTAATLPSSARWYSVTYGNGKFVAVDYNSTAAAYSTDGITWTAATLPASAAWYSVTYGAGKFVAVAQNSTAAAYSTDGINWTATTLPSSARWCSVTYGGGKFVAVVEDIFETTTAAYSEDGINWTATTLPSSADWQSVTYGAGKFVAVAEYTTTAAYLNLFVFYQDIQLATTADVQAAIPDLSGYATTAYVDNAIGAAIAAAY